MTNENIKKPKILFVCLGNICRSPTAEAIFKKMLADEGLSEMVDAGSCGTGGWHVGKNADLRSIGAAKKAGYDLSKHVARQLDFGDFYEYDMLIAMDQKNYFDLIEAAPREMQHKINLMLSFGSKFNEVEVPDPYYGGENGFKHVIELLEDACEGLIEELVALKI